MGKRRAVPGGLARAVAVQQVKASVECRRLHDHRPSEFIIGRHDGADQAPAPATHDLGCAVGVIVRHDRTDRTECLDFVGLGVL